jgi:hypothetical protein
MSAFAEIEPAAARLMAAPRAELAGGTERGLSPHVGRAEWCVGQVGHMAT